MKINKIEKIGNNKYKLTIDNEVINVYDNLILKYNLLYKNNIDLEMYNLIIEETEYYELYNKVVKYILKKRRSKKEIDEYLLKCSSNLEVNTKIINELLKNNLLNDEEFCKAYINDNIFLGKKGINKIKLELIKKGITIDIIDYYLNQIDNEIIINKLEKIIKKKIELNKKYSNNYLKQKILNDMIIMGYNKNDIIEILSREINDLNTDKIIQDTYIKLYRKLSKKYSGNELKEKLKVGLLSKGFNIEEINLYIQKTED